MLSLLLVRLPAVIDDTVLGAVVVVLVQMLMLRLLCFRLLECNNIYNLQSLMV